MRYRQIHAKMWKQDAWFLNLPKSQKLLFIYLISNEAASTSGIYELPIKVIAFETDLSNDEIEEGLSAFSEGGKAFYEDGVIWVKNLRKYYDSGSDKVAIGMMRDVAAIKDCPLRTRYMEAYGIDTVHGLVQVGEFAINLGQPADNGEYDYGPPAPLENTKPDKMTSALAYVTGMDPDIRKNRNRLDNTTVQLVRKYEPEFVIKRYGAPDGEWYTRDWRGMKGQHPTLANIQETIAKESLGTAPAKDTQADDYLKGLEDHLEY